MKAPVVMLDFASPPVRLTLPGVLLLVVGIGAAVAAGLEYHVVEVRRAGLEVKLAATLRHTVRNPAEGARVLRLSQEATKVAGELGTPWTAVLSDLEIASRDSAGSVSVLSIEPDAEKHRVRINAESRDLSGALAYVGKLQGSRTLLYPMLDSHEVVADDKDHPVRFAMTAQWRELP